MVRFLALLVAASLLGGCMVKVKAPRGGVKVHANPVQVQGRGR